MILYTLKMYIKPINGNSNLFVSANNTDAVLEQIVSEAQIETGELRLVA